MPLKKVLFCLLLIIQSFELLAQKIGDGENLFYNYLSQRFQEKDISPELKKKVWNYLSNPSKGYKYAGILPEEYASLVIDYVKSAYQKKIIDSLLEAVNIDTEENLPGEKRAENIARYVKHIEGIAGEFGLSVLNLQNKYLIVYSDGDQPPLGIVGKIKVSENFINTENGAFKEGIISDSPSISSKIGIELALFAAGILSNIGLKPRNRIIFYIDLTLTEQTDIDLVFNSFEIAPLNLVIDSFFPVVCSEYGYAMIRLVEAFKARPERMAVREILSDGGEYFAPENSILCLNKDIVDMEQIKDSITKFLKRYNKINIKTGGEKDYCLRFSLYNESQTSQSNALDYIVLFLTENRNLIPSGVSLFEYLRRNIALNPSGKPLGINRHHNLLKSTYVILKKIRIDENTCSANIYIRFPYGIESSELIERVKKNVALFNKKESSNIEVYANAYNPVSIDSNSEVIKRILKAYNNATGLNGRCVVADGLYTKFFPNAIGFGPEFIRGQKSSGIYEKDIFNVFNIYLTAFIFLMGK